ncbi:MAG: sodium:proton antiporter [Bacteroidaceae bacterium]|nr:sodium:proton antiporter [Bacteroidaceae bacterium]
MVIAIVCLILCSYALIATEHITHINKATIALFAGVLAWILYIATGTDFVMKMHSDDLAQFVGAAEHTTQDVKAFISTHVFLRYGADFCSLVLYFLATINIVSVLNSNGCFDFMKTWLLTKNSRRLTWLLVLLTFLISMNLDNLTTTVLMLTLLHRLVREQRWRMWLGAAIVIAANCGGAVTVIGDLTSLAVWTKGSVTPSNFSAALILPSLVATIIPTWFISRKLPEHIDPIRPSYTYRGDDSTLPVWQRWLLLVVGMGGLWFVPTFHRITMLPPFLGALCVLGVLWVLHELMNHKQIHTEQPMNIAGDRQFQFASLQIIMYFVGVYMCVGVMIETGIMESISVWCDEWIHNIYIMSIAIGAISSVLDNIALVLTAINIYPVASDVSALADLDPVYAHAFLQNGQYWHLIIYSGCIAGCLLPIGNISGYTLMKSEDIDIRWYTAHIMPKVLLGWGTGLATYFLVDLLLR